MSREESNNKAHSSYHEGLTATSTPERKRPSKQRGPYGTNNGTVQKRTEPLRELVREHPHKKSGAL
jgi:hypothetical protein